LGAVRVAAGNRSPYFLTSDHADRYSTGERRPEFPRIAWIKRGRKDPRSAMSRREQRLEFIRKNYLWPDRAKQWAEWLTQVVSEAQPARI
jgi:hypothetical protein